MAEKNQVRVRGGRITKAGPHAVGSQFALEGVVESLQVAVEKQIAVLQMPVAVFCLDAEAGTDHALGEDVVDILAQVVVLAEAVGFVMELAQAVGEVVPKP